MKSIKILFALVLGALLIQGCQKSLPVVVIPEPTEYQAKRGNFTIDQQTMLCFDNIQDDAAFTKNVRDQFQQHFGFTPGLSEGKPSKGHYILFSINDKADDKLGEEGYTMIITRRNITAKANTTRGLYYAFQTLCQLSYPSMLAEAKELQVPCLKMTDVPRFAYRGTHLDVSRHFFDTAYIKRYLDLLATYKINKFHWHLTDDHGWRIAIDKYPELTRIGAWRPERDSWDTLHPVQPDEPMTYGGFYTKEQIRDIIDYAAARYIDIIPEIEIPGHCSAILAAYPQFACDDYPYTVAVGPYWPPKAIMCAGNDQVLTFYKDVLAEVADLFPYPYIHIGGDEAFNDNWQVCPKCQARIQEKGLADEFSLQQWLMNEIEVYLKGIGKKAIIWDDVVSEDMQIFSTILGWQGYDAARIAAKHGNDVILCPTSHCYFNYYQGDPKTEPLAMTGLITLDTAYSFDPMPTGLDKVAQHHILGAQCNLWTEFINTPEQADYMLLPRLCALSECVWTEPSKKDYKTFLRKLDYHKPILHKMGYNCHP